MLYQNKNPFLNVIKEGSIIIFPFFPKRGSDVSHPFRRGEGFVILLSFRNAC